MCKTRPHCMYHLIDNYSLPSPVRSVGTRPYCTPCHVISWSSFYVQNHHALFMIQDAIPDFYRFNFISTILLLIQFCCCYSELTKFFLELLWNYCNFLHWELPLLTEYISWESDICFKSWLHEQLGRSRNTFWVVYEALVLPVGPLVKKSPSVSRPW